MEKNDFAVAAIKDVVTSFAFSAMQSGLSRSLMWILILLTIHPVVADDELVWSGPGCVLLKNGNVLSASDIVPQAAHLAVRLDQTGEVRIPIKDVVAIGQDRLELYFFQVSKTTRWGAGEHWQLAKWCLRQGLIEQSQDHYKQLKQLSGDHAKFKQLDSELKQALLQDPVMKAAMRTLFPSNDVSTASHSSAIRFDAQPKSLSSPYASDVSSANQESSQPKNITDRYAQDYFRMHIQPFLATRCGQAGCHGAYGKSNFHVAKNGNLHGQKSNDISLDSAVRFLDNENVEVTRLWLKATTAHGSQSAPSVTAKISADRDLLNRLRHWHQSINRTNTTLQMSSTVATGVPTLTPAPVSSISGRATGGAMMKRLLDLERPAPAALGSIENSLTRLAPAAQFSSEQTEGEGNERWPSIVNRPEIPSRGHHGMTSHPTTAPNANSNVTLPEVGSELLALEKEIAKLEEKERTRKASIRHDPEEFNRRFSGAKP